MEALELEECMRSLLFLPADLEPERAGRADDEPDSDSVDAGRELRGELERCGDERRRRILRRSLEAIETAEHRERVLAEQVAEFLRRHRVLEVLGLGSSAQEPLVDSVRQVLVRTSLLLRRNMTPEQRRSRRAELVLAWSQGSVRARWRGNDAWSVELGALVEDYLLTALAYLPGLGDAERAAAQLAPLLVQDLVEGEAEELLPEFRALSSREMVTVLEWRRQELADHRPDPVELALQEHLPRLAFLVDLVRTGELPCTATGRIEPPNRAQCVAITSSLAGLTGVPKVECVNFLQELLTLRFERCAADGHEQAQASLVHITDVLREFLDS